MSAPERHLKVVTPDFVPEPREHIPGMQDPNISIAPEENLREPEQTKLIQRIHDRIVALRDRQVERITEAQKKAAELGIEHRIGGGFRSTGRSKKDSKI